MQPRVLAHDHRRFVHQVAACQGQRVYDLPRCKRCVRKRRALTVLEQDNPLVIQFGAKSAEDFASAAQLVAPFAQAVDLNCGCPQKWAMQSGYGAHLLSDPDLIRDMVRQAMSRAPGLAVTIKIRIENDLKRTVQLAQTAEHLGVSWIAVHGRTARQRSSSPPDYAAIKLVLFFTTCCLFSPAPILIHLSGHTGKRKRGGPCPGQWIDLLTERRQGGSRSHRRRRRDGGEGASGESSDVCGLRECTPNVLVAWFLFLFIYIDPRRVLCRLL